jgi:hypothetical protein
MTDSSLMPDEPEAMPPRTRRGRKPFKAEMRSRNRTWPSANWSVCGAYATEAQAKQAIDAMNAKDKWFEYRLKP